MVMKFPSEISMAVQRTDLNDFFVIFDSGVNVKIY